MTDLLAQMRAAADRPDEAGRIKARDLLEALGDASFSSLLLAPALIVVTPLSGIPLLSSLCGMAIVLIAAQGLAGRRQAWLPDIILRQDLDAERAAKALDWMRKPLGWLERRTRRRLLPLVRRPFSTVVMTLCLLCGLVMPVLEFIPLSSSILGAAVLLFAIGLVARDGLVTALGLGAVGAGIAVVVSLTAG